MEKKEEETQNMKETKRERKFTFVSGEGLHVVSPFCPIHFSFMPKIIIANSELGKVPLRRPERTHGKRIERRGRATQLSSGCRNRSHVSPDSSND